MPLNFFIRKDRNLTFVHYLMPTRMSDFILGNLNTGINLFLSKEKHLQLLLNVSNVKNFQKLNGPLLQKQYLAFL